MRFFLLLFVVISSPVFGQSTVVTGWMHTGCQSGAIADAVKAGLPTGFCLDGHVDQTTIHSLVESGVYGFDYPQPMTDNTNCDISIGWTPQSSSHFWITGEASSVRVCSPPDDWMSGSNEYSCSVRANSDHLSEPCTGPEPEPEPEPELLEWECGTWSENTFNFTSGGPDMCVDGQMYEITEEASPVRNTDYEPDGTIICRDWYVATGESCTGGVVSNPGSGEGSEEWPAAHYCDQGGGSDGVSFCDTRDPEHPEYDPNLPPTDPGAIYCDEQGGHDGVSFCNTWSPHHPGHPDYDGTGDGDGGTSGDGSYPGPGGGGTGGTGEGGEGEDPPQIGFCPPGTVQSERHFHGEDQTAVCVPEGDEFDESLDGLDLSGELPPGWLVMPTLPEPSAGTCSCPEDHVISVMGSSVPISYGPICGVAELLRPVFLLLVYLGLAFFLFRMVAGGNK